MAKAKFKKMTKSQSADFNLGKSHAWNGQAALPDGSDHYTRGFQFGARTAKRLATVELYGIQTRIGEPEFKGREASLLGLGSNSCPYDHGTDEHAEWTRGFNAMYAAKIRHELYVDGNIQGSQRVDLVNQFRSEEMNVLGSTITPPMS